MADQKDRSTVQDYLNSIDDKKLSIEWGSKGHWVCARGDAAFSHTTGQLFNLATQMDSKGRYLAKVIGSDKDYG